MSQTRIQVAQIRVEDRVELFWRDKWKKPSTINESLCVNPISSNKFKDSHQLIDSEALQDQMTVT